MIDLANGVTLKKIGDQDVEENLVSLLELRNDIDTALIIMSRPLGQTPEDVRQWIQRRNAMSGCIFFGIFKNRKIAGYVMFTEECRISGVGEISITLHREARRLGLGPVALTGFIDFLSSALDYRKFVARILESNTSSIKLFERGGFRHVGTMRQHRRFNHRDHDIRIYELLMCRQGS